jgi:hypothetical protein
VFVNTDSAVREEHSVANLDVDLSIPAVVLVSNETSAYVHSKDDPTFCDSTQRICSTCSLDACVMDMISWTTATCRAGRGKGRIFGSLIQKALDNYSKEIVEKKV